MPLLDLNGTQLHVLELGSSGPPVVCLHGLLLGNLATWYFGVAPRLSESHRVILYDLRGHGRSAVPASGYDTATHVADLDALLHHETEPVRLLGHSFGGLVALRWALQHPERCAGLLLVDTPLPPTVPAEIATFVSGSAELMVDALPPALAEAVAKGGRQARRLVTHLVRLATETTLLTDLVNEQAPTDAALAALTVPVTLIYGSQSACLPSGEHLAATLPHAKLVRLTGGHYLHLDAPQALADAVMEAFA